MNSPDPIGSNVPPERPTNPTHFGGDGLYDSAAQTADTSADASLKVPLSEHLDRATIGSLEVEQRSQGSMWASAKRNHVPALLAVGGLLWLLTTLVRRSMGRS
jgi:hypothetical protein